EQTCPVAGPVGRLRPPMIEPPQTIHRQPGEAMGSGAVASGDETHPAGVVLESGVVERGHGGHEAFSPICRKKGGESTTGSRPRDTPIRVKDEEHRDGARFALCL